MDEEFRRGEETASARPPKPKKPRLIWRLLTVILTLALVLGAILIFLYRDRFSAESIRAFFGRTVSGQESAALFSYENGSNQTFALVGDGLAVASASGIQLLDSSGATVVKEITGMDAPAVAGGKSTALFYDVGGSVCKLASLSGTCVDVDAGRSILSASMGENGSFAVISEESGSKGLVQVFDSAGELLYQWYSGSGYPLRAQVSPDGKSLAVLCVSDEGSVIHFFRLSSENELTSVRYDGELLYDLQYLSGSRLAAIGEDGVRFFAGDGSTLGRYDFDGVYLSAYDLGGSGFATVYLTAYRAGTSGTLLTLDSEGKELGSEEVEGNLISLSVNGKQILLATSGSLAVYNQNVQLQRQQELLVTAKKALLRSRDLLLLSSYSAEPFRF